MKHRRCSHCKKKGPQESMLLRQLKAFCDQNCFAEWAAANVSKLAKKGKQIERKAFNERKRKVKLNDISHQRDMTQKAFNKMRVLQELDWFYSRGLEPTCISCGNPLGNDLWCCGHYKSRSGPHCKAVEKESTMFLVIFLWPFFLVSMGD
ncbi:MAG: recombination protein NinG [Pseudomonadota bacterium]